MKPTDRWTLAGWYSVTEMAHTHPTGLAQLCRKTAACALLGSSSRTRPTIVIARICRVIDFGLYDANPPLL
jgi:hypothetical protein